MPSEHAFEDKGKVKPKPAVETQSPQKENAPVSADPLAGRLDATAVQHMQQTVGNTAVQRFLAQRSGSGPTELDDDTASAINQQRGSGHSLDDGMAAKAGATMGQDFSGVKIHTDSQSDQLSHQLGAKAFTTGNDIFFRAGEYNPASSEGQTLIAHELTHVVQQGASAPSVQGKMAVNDPNDQYEAEADHVAETVMAQPDNIQREAEEDELQMQEVEEEEPVQAQEEEEPIQAQEEEDELQLQEEEEELAQAQEMEEEELVA
ncbi:MAG: DUF4157 domain-containing protein [Chloroflexi bacterium]|nr:DUF4157 domain-containing protein [Ardenticatenaceae bacterium]MBL1129628.1 DUF4157 domain-containing protein [Chloroflexota bacterium]NOG35708.1 DUF4157 domain-containing protein [Chloroflexota bacterium]GIK55948.1 MAG: hypothetical protein BroJett015_16110 [Chloroflexota bacterium]